MDKIKTYYLASDLDTMFSTDLEEILETLKVELTENQDLEFTVGTSHEMTKEDYDNLSDFTGF